MTIHGWDCSDFDWSRGPVDLAAAYADGIRMFTHKATEGTRVRHVHTGEAITRARVAGIPYLGVYCVPRTPGNGGNGTVAAQVQYLLDYVDAQVPWWRQHPGWFWQVDLEHWSNSRGTYDAVPPAVGEEMVDRLTAGTGRPVVLYAPRWAYHDTIGGKAPLWASDYGSNPAVSYRQAYAAAGGDKGPGWAAYSGRTPLIWQYGSRTRIGSQPQCDANAIRDEAAWKRLFTQTLEADVLSDQEFDLIVRGAITKDNALFYWLRRLAEGKNPLTGQPEGVGMPQLQEMLKTLLAKAEQDEVRDAAMKAAFDAIASGGTSVDTAAVLAAVNELRTEFGTQLTQLHDALAEAERERDEARHRLAAALTGTAEAGAPAA